MFYAGLKFNPAARVRRERKELKGALSPMRLTLAANKLVSLRNPRRTRSFGRVGILHGLSSSGAEGRARSSIGRQSRVRKTPKKRRKREQNQQFSTLSTPLCGSLPQRCGAGVSGAVTKTPGERDFSSKILRLAETNVRV
jgi:hypothetical protein